MTREEFYEKYGNVKVKFSSYYNYIFYFTGITEEGNKVEVAYGGNSSDIYEYDVGINYEMTVDQVNPYMGSVYCKTSGDELDYFYDY